MAEADNRKNECVKDHQHLRWDMASGASSSNGFSLGYGRNDETRKSAMPKHTARRQSKHNQEMWPMTRHAAMQFFRRYGGKRGDSME